MIQEFKDFINKGGVFEAAVGLILALAFAPVVQGLVDNILMPIIARIFGQPDFSSIRIGLGGSQEVTLDDGTIVMQEPTIEIGTWITTVVGFIIIGFVIFMLVKAYNRATNKAEEEEDGPSEVDLLTEIRDSLASRG
ncbi:MAG: large conductance mechanosensitive channel protein MscL [Actinomycetota bacterium]